ncbi:hypothetical protein C0J52_03744 [Blattella germanica]|nr:hypothetical protein C0J52_03744 [Blattella germanica]
MGVNVLISVNILMVSLLIKSYFKISNFSEGALCPNGGRHKIEIEFSCSKFNNGPLYIMTTKECVHHFSWETSVACPTLLDIGKDCKVRDLQHGHLYDFNTLHSEWDKLILTESDSSFRINLCRPLSKPCGNKNASICLKTGNKEIAIGEYLDYLKLKIGLQKCHILSIRLKAKSGIYLFCRNNV